jgi:hypothetical protein
VCLHACGIGEDVGALFGAMSMLSAIGHIVSPYIYALTYSSYVAQYPESIFILAACLLFSVVFCLGRVSPAEGEGDIELGYTSRRREDSRPVSSTRAYRPISESNDDLLGQNSRK